MGKGEYPGFMDEETEAEGANSLAECHKKWAHSHVLYNLNLETKGEEEGRHAAYSSQSLHVNVASATHWRPSKYILH